MPLSDRDRLRLEIGDTDTDTALFDDDELDTLLAERAANILLAAADACDILATRFARDFDFTPARGRQYSRSQRSEMYAKRADALRERASGAVDVTPVTKQDGYSDDLSTRDGAGSASPTGRVRAGYYDPDMPV